MNLSRTSGVQLHPTSLPSGRLGPDAYAWVDWLAAAGQTWWQMLPLGPPDEHGSPYKAASAFAAWPGLLARAARAGDARPSALDFRERDADWIEDWLAFAGADALDDQVRFDREWAALRALRRRARREADRRRPDLRRRRARPTSRAHPELFQRRRGGGRAAGRVHRQGPAVGQPAVRLAGAAAAAATRWWIARFRRIVRALRPRADRPLPRLRRLLGGARAAPSTRCEGALEARARAARRSTPPARRWASCR